MPKGPGAKKSAGAARVARGYGVHRGDTLCRRHECRRHECRRQGRRFRETQQKTLRSGLCVGRRIVDGDARAPRRTRGGAGYARPRPRALPLRRPEIRPRLRPLRLCRAGRAEGWHAAHGDGQHLQHAQPLHAQGRGRGGRGLPLREPAGRRGRRARLRLRTDRPSRRSGAEPALGAFPPQARGALAGRHADHRRRREVLVRDPHDRGRSRLRHPACRGRPGRYRRRSKRRLSTSPTPTTASCR